jgi:hypothetical protein
MDSTSIFRNEYPSPNEVQSIKSRIRNNLRDEVKQSQEIRVSGAALEKEIEVQLAVIPPIQNIPPEILGYIIHLHASMEWWAPALDGSVSRQFRQAVLTCPRAWSYPTLEKAKSRRRITRDAAEMWMERAGASPLHVQIDCYQDTLYRPILMRCPEQIVDLKYSGSIINLRTTRLPNLRRLFLSCSDDASTNPFLGGIDGKHPMPSLDTLGLSYLIRVPFALNPSFPPITALYLRDVSPGDCWGLVSHSSKTLKILMLDDCDTFNISEGTDFPVLEFLSLVRAECLIGFISAPNLCVFHRGHATNMLNTSFPSVVEYASFENEPIVWGVRMNWLDLEAVHSLLPSLQRLSLQERPKIVAWVLEDLARYPDIWPHLQLVEALVTSDAEVVLFSDLLDRRNSTAKVPITASWLWPNDKPKIPLRFVKVSILLSSCEMNTILTPIQDPNAVL